MPLIGNEKGYNFMARVTLVQVQSNVCYVARDCGEAHFTR